MTRPLNTPHVKPLGRAQRRALLAMRRGNNTARLLGVSSAVLRRLERRGLAIECNDRRWVLSDAGREAIAPTVDRLIEARGNHALAQSIASTMAARSRW